MIGTIILLFPIVLDKIFGLSHPQQSDVHSSSHLNRADVLLHPHQVSLKILVSNVTSLNLLLAVIVDLVEMILSSVLALISPLVPEKKIKYQMCS